MECTAPDSLSEQTHPYQCVHVTHALRFPVAVEVNFAEMISTGRVWSRVAGALQTSLAPRP